MRTHEFMERAMAPDCCGAIVPGTMITCGLPASAPVHGGESEQRVLKGEQRCEHGKTLSEYCFDCVKQRHNETAVDDIESPSPAKSIEEVAMDLAKRIRPSPVGGDSEWQDIRDLLIAFAEEIQRVTREGD